jgi:flavin-binding protein dodecin
MVPFIRQSCSPALPEKNIKKTRVRAPPCWRGATSPSGETLMSVARTTEITASSKKSFDDALKVGVKRAAKTLQNITGAWIKDQEVVIEDGKIVSYKVRMMVTFILK